MDRIYASGAAGSAPSVPASPSSGYPTAGNPGTGTPSTKPGPYWYHMIMEELMAIITAGGVTPAPGTLNQVKQALDALYAPKGAGSFKIQPIAASVASNALTVSLSPTSLDFRANSLSSGVVNTRTVGSAISLTVPSGATLGTVSGVAARLAILAIDNAGTIELAAVNLIGGVNLDETTLISTTAISSSSNSVSTIYSTTARSNVPFRVVGFVDITEATAGAWATAPSEIQGAGGMVFSALGGALFSSNGYQKLPSGLVIQWGTASEGVTTSFPVTFPNACLAIVATFKLDAYNTTGTQAYAASNSQFRVYVGAASGDVAYWIAIGY